MMKSLTVFFIGLILCCGGKMKITESTSQEWVGGLQESGYGTDYKIILKAKIGSDQLQFQELWVGDTYMKVRVMANPATPKAGEFAKGAMVTIKAGVTYRPGPDEKVKQVNSVDVKKPFVFKGAGLLGYTCKGKKLYLEISDFKQLEKIIYP
jgi:hypothetical protein